MLSRFDGNKHLFTDTCKKKKCIFGMKSIKPARFSTYGSVVTKYESIVFGILFSWSRFLSINSIVSLKPWTLPFEENLLKDLRIKKKQICKEN